MNKNLLIIYLLLLSLSCGRKERINPEGNYSKINFYYKDSFDLRISDFLSNYPNSINFTFIDYATCARCSESKIIDYFDNLNIEKNLTLFFNDSSVYYRYSLDYPLISWEFLKDNYWDEYEIRSSNIIEYKKIKNKYKRIDKD